MRRFWMVLGTVIVAMTGYLAAQAARPTPLPENPTAVGARIEQLLHPLSYSDVYCAGFVAKPSKVKQFVTGGLNTPHQNRFAAGNYIFLKGNDFSAGSRVSIVRKLNDPNRFYPFHGESKTRGESQIYADVAYAVVVEQRANGVAIAQLEFSCDEVVVGDQVVPFAARQVPPYRSRSSLERFPVGAAQLSGRILAARDFEQYLGAGRKVYIDLGAQQGLKSGDYFRIVRGYERRDVDVADANIRHSRSADDTQKLMVKLPEQRLSELPRRVVGEVIVLSTQPNSATAMITFALEDVHVGDRVELESKPNSR